MIRCVIRAIRVGRVAYPDQAAFWLFPADSRSGHFVEHKEDRGDLSKWGNELRQTYRTLAQAAGISQLDIHLLMNHSLPGVNAGYITRDGLLGDHLRRQQERISKFIVEAAENRDGQVVTVWLRHSKRDDAMPYAALEQGPRGSCAHRHGRGGSQAQWPPDDDGARPKIATVSHQRHSQCLKR